MERTQIYLTQGQTRALDQRAQERGTTRSHLIREALDQYLGFEHVASRWDPERFIAALNNFAGIWADRDDIDEIYADLRKRNRERLRDLWGDRLGPDADPDPKARE